MNSHTKKFMAGAVSIALLVVCGVLTLIYSDPTSVIRVISFSAICLVLGGLMGKAPFPQFYLQTGTRHPGLFSVSQAAGWGDKIGVRTVRDGRESVCPTGDMRITA